MNEDNPFLKHITISLTVFAVLLVILLIALPSLQNLLKNLSADAQSYITLASVILSILLLSYIVYLLLSINTRANLIARRESEGLAVSREQFVKLYEEAPIPYVMLDQDSRISRPNKAALRFFGVVSQEISGKSLFDMCVNEDKELADKLLHFYKLNMPINREQLRLADKNGNVKWVLLSVFFTGNSLSIEEKGLATIFDISEQKQLDQAKTEFVSLASHQLRSPLAAIKWCTQILMSGDVGGLTEKQNEYIGRINGVNEEMIDLVNTLLNVSRIEIGTLTIDKSPTDVQKLCESILDELAPQISEKSLTVEKRYEAKMNSVNTDPKLLRIVMQNLLSNAVKYTPANGRVTVFLGVSDGQRQISVYDTGYGIPKDQQDRIFTKLFRADNVRKIDNIQGTGLGLYLVKSIIEALGGSIGFQSEENKGSVFTVIF